MVGVCLGWAERRGSGFEELDVVLRGGERLVSSDWTCFATSDSTHG